MSFLFRFCLPISFAKTTHFIDSNFYSVLDKNYAKWFGEKALKQII